MISGVSPVPLGGREFEASGSINGGLMSGETPNSLRDLCRRINQFESDVLHSNEKNIINNINISKSNSMNNTNSTNNTNIDRIKPHIVDTSLQSPLNTRCM